MAGSRPHCCRMMTYFVNYRCDQHPPYECSDYVIRYADELRQYTILIHDGENGSSGSGIIIHFCPWCGTKLPAVLEDGALDGSLDVP